RRNDKHFLFEDDFDRIGNLSIHSHDHIDLAAPRQTARQRTEVQLIQPDKAWDAAGEPYRHRDATDRGRHRREVDDAANASPEDQQENPIAFSPKINRYRNKLALTNIEAHRRLEGLRGVGLDPKDN